MQKQKIDDERRKNALALEDAIDDNDMEGVMALLADDLPAAHHILADGFTPFEKLKTSSPEMIEAFLSKGVDVNWRDEQGRNMARFCAEDNCLTSLAAFAWAGIDLDRADHYGRRPVQEAIENGHPEVVAFLLSKGVKLEKYWLKELQDSPTKSGHACLDVIRAHFLRIAALAALKEVSPPLQTP